MNKTNVSKQGVNKTGVFSEVLPPGRSPVVSGLIKFGALVIALLLGLKERKNNNKKEEPFWKRRMKLNINSSYKYFSHAQQY